MENENGSTVNVPPKHTWAVGDLFVHRRRGPGVVRLVQLGRVRVVFGDNGSEMWVSTR